MDFDVGTRLREIRVAAGLSQRELAARASVPHGLISVIEQNKSSPSVSSLRKILGGVPMTLAEFFKEHRSAPGKIFFKPSDFVELTSHLPARNEEHPARIDILQVGDAKAANLQLMYQRYEPGADTGATMFQHEAHEGGVVLRGELELTVGDRVGRLKAGDAYLFDSRTPHRYRNVGDETCEVVVACTPPFL
jgi:transcriptional regulator with XRE-family HTH domain